MKIISSFMEEIKLQEGEFHSICFKSGKIQQLFRQLLKDSLTNKVINECTYVQLLDDKGNKLNNRQVYYIEFDCNVLNLTDDKNTQKHVQELLFYFLENNPEFIEEYVNFNEHLHKFVNTIELQYNDLIIEFSPNTKTIQNMIKSLEIHFEFKEDEFIPNYILRDYLIKTLLMMNMLEKDVLLLITYPETDIGFLEFKEVINLIKKHNVTTLVISAQREFLSAANIDQMFLIEENGTIYDILNLKKEVDAFNILDGYESEQKVKELAFFDYLNDLTLLNEKIKHFLESNRI